MGFRFFVLLIAFGIGLLVSLTDFAHGGDLPKAALILAVVTATGFVLLSSLLERFVYKRIRNVYKLIHRLKLGKDLKAALGDHIPDDPIAEAERAVRVWIGQHASEIQKLQEQAQFRREFLSNISHEFKTPLFAAQGYIETLRDGLMDDQPPTAKNFLEKASRNLDRLGYLIRDMDEIAKLESGISSLRIEKFDVNALISECAEDLERKAARSGIRIRFNKRTAGPSWVRADRERIRQVLANLIENSIKYGRRNGTTTISTFPLFDQVIVEVTDDGPGIAEKNLNRVFERFYRADGSRSREVGGSGLGLAIVKHIIEAHGQNVHVRSTERIGTTFGFTLGNGWVDNR